MLVGNRVGVNLTPCSLLDSHLREQVNSVRVVVSPVALAGQHPWMENPTNKGRLELKPTVSNVRITTSIKCACNLCNIACGRWSPVTN